MFGLILSGLVSIWLALSMVIAAWLGKFLPKKPWRIPLIVLIFFGVFLLPVADELIAWPAMNRLCAQVAQYEYDERLARGRTVRSTVSVGSRETITLFPGIDVLKLRADKLDANTGERVFSWYQITTNGGKIGVPSSSGERYPVILPQKCSVVGGYAERAKLFRDLKITEAIADEAKNDNH